MKKISAFLFLILTSTVSCQTYDLKIKSETIQKILDSLNVQGSVLLYDLDQKTYYSNDFTWANTGFLPASTFKIPNSILGLETGILTNENHLFEWNGEKRGSKNWETNLTLAQAFRVSCVPCYQELAKSIGTQRMKAFLVKIDYPKMDVTTQTLDKFWLVGNSRITQFQQIEFLKKLYYSELPISKKTTKVLKKILLFEKTAQYSLSGKTGLSETNSVKNGWFVGYFENNKKLVFFATNIEPKPENKDYDAFILARINATKAAYKTLLAQKNIHHLKSEKS